MDSCKGIVLWYMGCWSINFLSMMFFRFRMANFRRFRADRTALLRAKISRKHFVIILVLESMVKLVIALICIEPQPESVTLQCIVWWVLPKPWPEPKQLMNSSNQFKSITNLSPNLISMFIETHSSNQARNFELQI